MCRLRLAGPDDAAGHFVRGVADDRRTALLQECAAAVAPADTDHRGAGVLRGLHYQIRYPQGKLVRVISGEVFDVAVDLRHGSVTYGKWHGELLSADNKKQFYIPEGFAHGFYVLSETAEFCYKVTDFYHPNDEGGIRWNDPDIGVVWPLIQDVPVLLSEKDQVQPFLKELNQEKE